MGTVHAKSEGGRLEMESGAGGMELGGELPQHNIKLNGVKARVDRVNVDGLSRTRDDFVRSTVDELFQATDFEDVILRAHRVRRALDSLGCFRDIGVFIDVSSGPHATPEGLEVTFQVKELSRIVGGVNTTVSENEGNLVVEQRRKTETSLLLQLFVGYLAGHHISVKMPNVLGRGERLSAEYALGHRSSSNCSVQASKPFVSKHNANVSVSAYQQNHEFPWSGYRLLDRGVITDLGFSTSPKTRHSLQWEGMVRETSVLGKTASFRVRESSGPVMKSILRHIVTVDQRDEPVFPTEGTWTQFSSEVSGIGGGIANLKTELQFQTNHTVVPSVVVQACIALGVLHDMFGTDLPDHYYLGGPTSVRGFRQRGLGPHTDRMATGGKLYWAGGMHVFCPLPFRPGQGGLGDLLRTHGFITAGALAEDTHTAVESLALARVSIGLGIALRLGSAARLELNYCVPIRAMACDVTAPGLQFGVGATFL